MVQFNEECGGIGKDGRMKDKAFSKKKGKSRMHLKIKQTINLKASNMLTKTLGKINA